MGLLGDILKVAGLVVAGAAVGAAVGAGVTWIALEIKDRITERRLQEKLREESNKFGHQLYAEIESVQPNKVKLTEYTLDGNKRRNVEYHSNEGVSADLYKGQKIYC